jgi:hypothetical protein
MSGRTLERIAFDQMHETLTEITGGQDGYVEGCVEGAGGILLAMVFKVTVSPPAITHVTIHQDRYTTATIMHAEAVGAYDVAGARGVSRNSRDILGETAERQYQLATEGVKLQESSPGPLVREIANELDILQPYAA